MAYTLTSLVARVQRRIRDTGYSSSEITEYLNDAQNDVFNEYQLRFMENTATYTTVASVSDITNGAGLPTDYVEAISLTVTTSGQEQVVPYIAFERLEEEYPDSSDTTAHAPGQPLYWTVYGNTVSVFPAPSTGYTVSLRYRTRPVELTTDTQVPQIPQEFAELLVAGAVYRVLQVKDNYDQAGIWQNKYDELLGKLVQRYSQRQSGVPRQMRINRRAQSKTSF